MPAPSISLHCFRPSPLGIRWPLVEKDHPKGINATSKVLPISGPQHGRWWAHTSSVVTYYVPTTQASRPAPAGGRAAFGRGRLCPVAHPLRPRPSLLLGPLVLRHAQSLEMLQAMGSQLRSIVAGLLLACCVDLVSPSLYRYLQPKVPKMLRNMPSERFVVAVVVMVVEEEEEEEEEE